MTDDTHGGVIRRRTARSGVDYSQEVTLHETSRTRIILRSWFIRHDTRPTGLSIKFERIRRGEHGFDVGLTPEVELTLDEDATARLLTVLQQHTAVAAGSGAGDYAVIQIDQHSSAGAASDPAGVAQAVHALLQSPEVIEHFSAEELAPALVAALRGSVRLGELKLALAELGEMMEQGVTDERRYQIWCESHSWAFGLGYLDRDNVRRVSAGDDLDLMMPAVAGGYRDIVELKRPTHQPIRLDESHQSWMFSREASSAIGQCARYLDVLHEDASHGLRDHPEVVAYHPRAIIVMGRSHDWDEQRHRGLRALNGRLHGITLMTYDHLLAQGERLIEILGEQVD